MIRWEPLFKIDPEIHGKICDLFMLPPEHDHIRQTDDCVYLLGAAIIFQEHADVYMKLDAIVKQALRLQLEACAPI